MDTHNILELLALIVSFFSLAVAVFAMRKNSQKELDDRISSLELFRAQYQERIDYIREIVKQHQKVREDRTRHIEHKMLKVDSDEDDAD